MARQFVVQLKNEPGSDGDPREALPPGVSTFVRSAVAASATAAT
jgi:hypothetical protein